ncbi:Aldose 1-epimerase [Thalictrum thalictroides]|uniref:Aldose 1-epimerase n=1 Tax=Thalictrum thalictroides TaxID=46969 RepID=A0A7J6VXC0_THATH|nr:Aldose 1-epimerase [Thalictrum thalictroides]
MAKLSLILCFIFITFSVLNLCNAKKKVGIYELKNGDLSINVTNYGATILSVLVPDKQGNVADVVLGFENFGDYLHDDVYFGAIAGRVANRVGGAKFTLDGKTYKLFANDGKNTLHGGHRGFSDVIWTVSEYVKDGSLPHIVLNYNSFDGEEGFPGDLNVSVTYALTDKDKLSVTMKAKALNKPTPVNLAQHTYWNLNGHNSGDILSHEIQIFASNITPVDANLIPTGKLTPVKGTPYDFLEPQTVGSRINELKSGYDINYALDEPSDKIKKVVVVHDSKSGRTMELWANKPGVQFYSGNMLKAEKGKDGAVYGPHDGLALETQGFPDSVNHPNFPSQIVTPEKPYEHFMLYRFSTS